MEEISDGSSNSKARNGRLEQRINRHLKKAESMKMRLNNVRGGPRRRGNFSARGWRGGRGFYHRSANNFLNNDDFEEEMPKHRIEKESNVINTPKNNNETSNNTNRMDFTSTTIESPIDLESYESHTVIGHPAIVVTTTTTDPIATAAATPALKHLSHVSNLQFIDDNGNELFVPTIATDEGIIKKLKLTKLSESSGTPPLSLSSSGTPPSSSGTPPLSSSSGTPPFSSSSGTPPLLSSSGTPPSSSSSGTPPLSSSSGTPPSSKKVTKKTSRKIKKSAQQDEVKHWLIDLESKLSEWGYSVINNDLRYTSYKTMKLDYVCEDFQFIDHEINFDNMVDTLVNQHSIICFDGVYRIAKIGSIYGHFTIDDSTGLAKIFTTKVKNYKIDLHHIIGMYKVRDDKMNVQERTYVQTNKLLELCGNELIDDGYLRNLDNLHKSTIRMLYSVPMTESFFESLENVIRYDEHHINSKVLIPKLLLETSIMESIGYEVVPCIPCAAIFHAPHTHQGCRFNVTKRRIRMESLDMLGIDDRAPVAEQYKAMFNVDTYQEALVRVKTKVESAQMLINSTYSSKRIKILCGKPWYRLKDFSHFYKDLDEEDEVFCARDWLVLEFKTEKGGYCCNRGSCANSDQVVTLFEDLLVHLKEKHFQQVRREELVKLLEKYIIEEKANEIGH